MSKKTKHVIKKFKSFAGCIIFGILAALAFGAAIYLYVQSFPKAAALCVFLMIFCLILFFQCLPKVINFVKYKG